MRFQVAAVAGLLVVSGCTTMGLGRGSNAGSTGPTGGAKPQQVATTIINAMGGGLIGGSIGNGLDSAERRSALEAEYRALEHTPSGQVVTWRGDNGRYGEVVAAQPYRVGSQDCRQYKHTVITNGESRVGRGTACRNPDGSWTPLT
jgi:surface antigen